MPSLISGRVQVTAPGQLTNSRFQYLNLTQAQPALGDTPTTSTGYTLVSTPNGIKYTNSLGNLVFSSGTITTNITNGNISLLTTGTAAIQLQSNLVNVSNSMAFNSSTSYISLGGRPSTRIPNYYEGIAPPTNIQLWEGDQWYDPIADVLYEYTLDNNGRSWVDITGPYFSAAAFVPANGLSFTGSQGFTGSRGYPGSRGFAGSYGDPGRVGYTGSASTATGYAGSKGSTGTQGVIGYTGSASTATGYVGSKGSTGTVGFTGSTGTVGFVGSKGDPGLNATPIGSTTNLQLNSLGVGTTPSNVTGNITVAGNINLTGTPISAGNINITGALTQGLSDERLKTNLGNITNALDKVMSLNGFYYEVNAIAQALGYEVKREVGVSAQQVQKVLPEIVTTAPIDAQYLTIYYEKLTPLLIEAIKELKNEIDQLKGSI